MNDLKTANYLLADGTAKLQNTALSSGKAGNEQQAIRKGSIPHD